MQDDLPGLPPPGKLPILARLKRAQKILEAARQDLLEASRLHHPLTAAAEWIIDNPYLIRTQVNEVRRHLPRDYAKLLRTKSIRTAAIPRVPAGGATSRRAPILRWTKEIMTEFLRESQDRKGWRA